MVEVEVTFAKTKVDQKSINQTFVLKVQMHFIFWCNIFKASFWWNLNIFYSLYDMTKWVSHYVLFLAFLGDHCKYVGGNIWYVYKIYSSGRCLLQTRQHLLHFHPCSILMANVIRWWIISQTLITLINLSIGNSLMDS